VKVLALCLLVVAVAGNCRPKSHQTFSFWAAFIKGNFLAYCRAPSCTILSTLAFPAARNALS
jgi:hypothetical protein